MIGMNHKNFVLVRTIESTTYNPRINNITVEYYVFRRFCINFSNTVTYAWKI